jgi:antibiotic biosynthesis monooxygenase (ABM) superfamily enzyme
MPEPSSEPVAAPHDAAAEDDAGEAAAWAEVEAAWTDEARHRAYLARFHDLEGLAAAGGRYRAALAARPGDPIAARFRDEVVRRAVAHGLASLPRSPQEHPRWKAAVRVAAGVVIGGLLLAAVLLTARLLPLLGAR